MRVLLVNPYPKNYYKSTTCPLGLLSIATYLRKLGHVIQIVDSTVKQINYKKTLNRFLPDVVGVSVLSYKSVSDALKVSRIAHDENLPVIWGGPLASVIPAIVLNNYCVDYVVIGEGEITFAQLLDAMSENTEIDCITGLAYKINNEIVINHSREFADLAEFPVLDWSFVNPADYFQSLFAARKMLYLYSAKGCPCHCTFCFNESFNKCEYRKRPFEYCIEEIKYLVANFGMDGVHFADELWCSNKKEIADKCGKLVNTGLNIIWGCNARIGTLDQADFALMFRSGCRWIFFGVESGSQSMQEKIKKGISLSKVEETVKNCAAAGIVPVASFIIGLPDETPEQVMQTIALARRMTGTLFDFNFYFPLAGSAMCDDLEAKGRYRIPANLKAISRLVPTEKLQYNLSKTPARELKVVRAFFMWAAFTGNDTVSQHGKHLLVKKALSDAAKGLLGKGAKNFFLSFAYDAQTFIGIIFYLVFFPAIRRKYSLYKTGKR